MGNGHVPMSRASGILSRAGALLVLHFPLAYTDDKGYLGTRIMETYSQCKGRIIGMTGYLFRSIVHVIPSTYFYCVLSL